MLHSLVIQGRPTLSSRSCGFLSLFSLKLELDLLGVVTSVLFLSKLKSGVGLGMLGVERWDGTAQVS